MKTIGLTGGIGSGKTTVARMFKVRYSVYIADEKAKELMHTSMVIRDELQQLLGEEVYKNGELDRAYMADKIFNDKTLLEKVNQIVHPRVEEDFQEWIKKHQAPYCIKEAAILFENDGYKRCDKTILVVANEEERIKRVMMRDGVEREKVLERIKNQWSDAKKIPLANYVLKNEALIETKKKLKICIECCLIAKTYI